MIEILIKLGILDDNVYGWANAPEIDTGYSASWILGDLDLVSITKLEMSLKTHYTDYPVMLNFADNTNSVILAGGVYEKLHTLTVRYWRDINGDIYPFKISLF
jgi:hypothetical protein